MIFGVIAKDHRPPEDGIERGSEFMRERGQEFVFEVAHSFGGAARGAFALEKRAPLLGGLLRYFVKMNIVSGFLAQRFFDGLAMRDVLDHANEVAWTPRSVFEERHGGERPHDRAVLADV